ncbi:MAG: cytochrome P450 [Gammaproteobacteria bacterium]|jgi:cytochrome P450|nr:cytochrome P450 [Gammaproteobacteria bacterium]
MSATGELGDDLLERGSLGDAAVQEDPTPYHHALHRRPIHYDPRLGFFICSTYALMRQILRDPETFSSVDSQRADALREPPAEVVALRRESYPAVNTLVTNDPPSHTRFRRMVDDPFRPRSIAALRNAIHDVVEETVDTFAGRGEFEAVRELAIPVPVKVIADMLGLDRGLAPRIKAWSDASVEPLGMMIDDARLVACTRLIKEFQDFIAAELEQRRQRPREDLLTSLVTARDAAGEGFSMPEMLSLTQQLLVAGNETTTNAIAAGVQLLIEHPEVAERLRLRQDDTELRRFAEEVLRLESPVQGLFRIVTRDVCIDGVQLPAGARVMLRFAAANRDPAQFADPDRLDVERRNAGTHLAFGAGIHHCLGASLAREELVSTFAELLRRGRSFALVPGQAHPRHHPSLILRGLESLQVRFEPL